MCTFTFTYADGGELDYEHVKSASYTSAKGQVCVSEQELITHAFPLGKVLWLFSESGSFCASDDGLRCIKVIVE